MLIGIDASRANEEHKTGVGWYAYFLIQELKKMQNEAFESRASGRGECIMQNGQPMNVVLYTNKPLVGELAKLPEGWTVKVLKWGSLNRSWRFWTQIRLSWEMLINPPDVLFIPAHVFPIIHPKKTVMTVHDIAAVKFPESYNWFEKWYTLWSARYAVKNLWKVIVPSDFTKRELIAECRMQNAECEKMKVISHGYDERYGKRYETNIKQILNKYYVDDAPYLLSIGRLEHKKNTINIIKAFENCKLKIENLKLVLVGQPGHGYEKVHQAIVDSPFKNDIITPGWVSDEDLPYLMQGAEVFVFPSLYEGFGIPILEAMASGVPVVTSKDVGSASFNHAQDKSLTTAAQEVGGEACVYADPQNTDEIAEAIIKLLQNADLRMQNVGKGLERVKEFGWNKCAEETVKLLYC